MGQPAPTAHNPAWMNSAPHSEETLMTWTIKARRHGFLLWLLVSPTLHRTRSQERAEMSRWPYRPDWKNPDGFRLTPLGVIHVLTGLTVELTPGRRPKRTTRAALSLLDRFLHWSLDWYINRTFPGWGTLQLWQWNVCDASERCGDES